MARIATVVKMRKRLKFATRFHNRCRNCGRGRGFYRDFGLCRLCFRKMAHRGEIPGIVKSSW